MENMQADDMPSCQVGFVLFKRIRKEAKRMLSNDKEENVFKQELEEKNEYSGLVFIMRLFMKEKCSMPDEKRMQEVMQKHIGNVVMIGSSSESTNFAVEKYKVSYKDGTVSPMLMITGCCESSTDNIDAFTRSQMWDCPEHERILSECGYQVVATDMLAGGLDAADRADMLMDYLEALIELYPMCEAVYIQNSGKMFTAEQIRSHNIPKESRFIYFAVNARFFNIQGTEDMVVDTLGMSVLSLPDLQYHFHGTDPNAVVNHAYNMLSYIFANDNPIDDNDTIDGIADGRMTRDVQWNCHYEDALIQPPRLVIDICMNEYASGGRDY